MTAAPPDDGPRRPGTDDEWSQSRPAPRGWQRFFRRGRTSLLVLLALLPLTGGIAGLTVASLATPTYTAQAYILVTSSAAGADASALNVANAMARVATSEAVLIDRRSGNRLSAAAQDGRLTASSSPDAPLIEVSATANSGDDAAALTNLFADQVSRHVAKYSKPARVRAEVFAFASPPLTPSSPNELVNWLVGVALGVVAAAVLYVVRGS